MSNITELISANSTELSNDALNIQSLTVIQHSFLSVAMGVNDSITSVFLIGSEASTSRLLCGLFRFIPILLTALLLSIVSSIFYIENRPLHPIIDGELLQ